MAVDNSSTIPWKMFLYCAYILLLLTTVAEYGLVNAAADCVDNLGTESCQTWIHDQCKNPLHRVHAEAHCRKTCGFC
ncbi:hypothetical protein Y032_0274g1013 [Ancylostoma ceylanicum]|uniref:ShKT domain-containing protein n=1 Tax=Ancylostoma ceylanicum TaxID=53326 RepID=A0A016S8N1_9BILA|nr:hypothetical protein Y032_0274g1013 [Ancylostoma ceylanicum]